jgi:hypothetical protein
MKKFIRFIFQAGITAMIMAGLLLSPLQPVQASGLPTMLVKSVITNSSVTVIVGNLPPTQTYTVRLGAYGTQGFGGSVVANFDTRGGGAYVYTFEIPTSLFNAEKIDLRIESNGTSTYTTFVNKTSDAPVLPGTSAIPTLSVVTVVKDVSATVRISGLPTYTDFVVRMGTRGTQGVGGSVVAGFTSGAGASQLYTFAIATKLIGSTSIDMRIDSVGGSSAWTTFTNASAAATATPPTGGSAYLRVISISSARFLTFTALNLPANTSFVVKMGVSGSRGIGGTITAGFDTKEAGTYTRTVEIPTNLIGVAYADLRIESGTTFAIYTTFHNVVTP